MKRFLLILIACIPCIGHSQLITTVAGNGTGGYSGNGGLATAALVNLPLAIAFDKNENLYFCDDNSTVRKIDKQTGVITAYCGSGVGGVNGDGGPAASAEMMFYAGGLAFDTSGNMLVSDIHRVRKVDAATGVITTIIGGLVPGFSGDGGPATAAEFNEIRGIAVDDSGNSYLSDWANGRIRKVSSAGVVSTIAGNGTVGSGGDNGPALNAQFSNVWYVCLDKENHLLYLTDANRIRKIDLNTGIITHVAGTGTPGYNGDEISADTAMLNFPQGMAVDGLGRLFFVDSWNQRVRMIDNAGIIHTVAGDGTQGYNGDNIPAMQAKIFNAKGLALDSCGNMYFGDGGTNHRLRKVSFNPNCFPLGINESVPSTFTISPNPATSQLTITSTGKLQNISIVNAIGQEVHRADHLTEKTIVNIHEFPSGIYILHVTGSDGVKRAEKFLKQ